MLRRLLNSIQEIPLLFESGDEHTLVELIKSLMKDGESVEQGVFLIAVVERRFSYAYSTPWTE